MRVSASPVTFTISNTTPDCHAVFLFIMIFNNNDQNASVYCILVISLWFQLNFDLHLRDREQLTMVFSWGQIGNKNEIGLFFPLFKY